MITGAYYVALYWIDWLTKSGRNGHIWRRRKFFFVMTMHHLTRRILHRLKSMNWVSNRFRIHRILQTWPPSDYYLFQTSSDGCVVSVLSRTKKLNGKEKGILKGLTNRIIWMAWKIERSLDWYWAKRRIHWGIKPMFAEKKKFFFTLSSQYQTS